MMDSDTGTGMATHEEICDGALTHYEKLATECHSWYSVVPKAIEFYKQYGPGVKKNEEEENEIAEARRVMREAFEEDAEFKQTYLSNIAMLLFDDLDLEQEVRDRVSEKILQLIFY